MMAKTADVQRSLSTIRNIEGFPLFVHITRLIALGQPVPVDRLAEAASWTVEEVEAALARHPAVERDEEGRLVGLGATLRPTEHRFTFSAGTLHGACPTRSCSLSCSERVALSVRAVPLPTRRL